jgi:2-hydroxy-6-oxonona-2,4-dienedioate hydrolase
MVSSKERNDAQHHAWSHRAPTMVVWGTRGYIVPRRSVERVADLIPDAKLAIIPGATHGMNYSHPRPFARCVLTFLASRAIPSRPTAGV